MSAPLLHLSESKLEQLRSDARVNLHRYRGAGFADLAREPGWAIDLDLKIDVERLKDLDGSTGRAETDLKDSLLIADVLKDLSPSLANEERIWARLSHVEAFDYSKRRWLQNGMSDEDVLGSVEKHFFARTQTRLRDDHALSRLWWNGQIARHCYPENPGRALELMLTRLDVRSNIVERVWLTGRRKLAGALFRAMDSDAFVLQSEASFREVMKAVNLLGGGIVFEAMTDSQVDDFLKMCRERAEAAMSIVA